MAVILEDVIAPKTGRLTLKQLSENEVLLTTSNFTDNVSVIGYRIYVDGVFLADVAANANGQLSYTYFEKDLAGKRTFKVIAYDAANRQSKEVISTLTDKDITPPDQVTSLSVQPNANQLAATLTWGIPEDNVGVVSYEIYVDGKKYTSNTNSLTIKNLTAGAHQYTVIAVDKAKNKSTVSDALLFDVADITAPQTGKVTLKQFSEDEILITTDKFSDNVGVVGYRIYLDGVFYAESAANANGQLSYCFYEKDLAGKYTFTVVACDAMGVESKGVTASVTIKDVTPPDQVQNLAVRPGATEQSTTLIWDVPADNEGATSYEIYVDGKKYTSNTNSLTIKKLTAGSHQYTVIAVDKAKNKSAVSEALLFDVADSTAPKTGKLTLKQFSEDEILITTDKFSDNVGVVGYRIYRDGVFYADVAANADGQLSYTYNQPDLAGKYTFTVVACDAMGVESKGVKASVTIKDVTPPDQVQNLAVRPGATEQSTTLIWDVPADNEGATSYEIYVDGKKYTSKTNSLTIKKLTAGSHQYTVIAVDKAKNKSAVSEALLFDVADSTAPKTGKLMLKQLSEDEILLTTSKFSDNVGVVGYRIYRDGVFYADVAANADGQLSYTYNQPDLAGKYTFTVVAYDAMGIETKGVKSTLTVKDVTPPDQVQNLSIRPDSNTQSTTLTWDIPLDNVGVVSYEIYVDGKKYTSKTNSLTIKKLTAGTHQYYVYAVDKAKNKSIISATERFSIGTAPDVLTISGIDSDLFEEFSMNDLPPQAVYGDIISTTGTMEIIFTANQSRSVSNIRLGAGNDVLRLKDSSLKKEESVVQFRDSSGLDLGEGNNFIAIGTNTELTGLSFLTAGNGNNTIELNGGDLNCYYGAVRFGNGNDVVRISGGGDLDLYGGTLDFGNGQNRLIVEGASSSVDTIQELSFGSGNDEISIINGAEMELCGFYETSFVQMGYGNDSINIGRGSKLELDSDLDFGEGSDELIINGTLHLKSDASISGLETISGTGTVAVYQPESADPALLQQFADAGLSVIDTQGMAHFTSVEEELADNAFHSAAAGSVSTDGDVEYDFWLCSAEIANDSLYGFVDTQDYLKFSKTGKHESLNFEVESGTARVELFDSTGVLIHSFGVEKYGEYDLRELKNGTYYLKLSCPEVSLASGGVEIEAN